MSEASTKKTRPFSRRTLTLIWSLIVASITITLLVYERIDVLYILATLALVALLIIVATSNLEGTTKVSSE